MPLLCIGPFPNSRLWSLVSLLASVFLRSIFKGVEFCDPRANTAAALNRIDSQILARKASEEELEHTKLRYQRHAKA